MKIINFLSIVSVLLTANFLWGSSELPPILRIYKITNHTSYSLLLVDRLSTGERCVVPPRKRVKVKYVVQGSQSIDSHQKLKEQARFHIKAFHNDENEEVYSMYANVAIIDQITGKNVSQQSGKISLQVRNTADFAAVKNLKADVAMVEVDIAIFEKESSVTIISCDGSLTTKYHPAQLIAKYKFGQTIKS